MILEWKVFSLLNQQIFWHLNSSYQIKLNSVFFTIYYFIPTFCYEIIHHLLSQTYYIFYITVYNINLNYKLYIYHFIIYTKQSFQASLSSSNKMNTHYYQSKSFEHQQSQQQITPHAIYQTLINQTPNLYPLNKFKTNKASSKQLFPDAVKYPDFFDYNLVSPGRVIKKLEGRQSIIRGFYYQLMKLAFQIEIEDKDYIQIMKCVIFSPQLMLEDNPSSPSSGKNYSDLQYKKIVAQFMELLMNQSIPNFQLSILSYPIADQAMIKILENILKFKTSLTLSTSPNNLILQKLSQIFQVTVVQYGNCYKFQESDIFLYEHSQQQHYIAFLNQMAQMSDVSQSSRRKQSNNQHSQSRRKRKSNHHRTQSEISQQNQHFDISPKRRNRHQLNSQYEIDSTPTRQPPRHCSSNLTQNKTKQIQIKNDKNYRNTYGFNQIRNQNDDAQTIDLADCKNKQKINDNQNNRASRDTIIHELHKLVRQSTQSHNTENNLRSTRDNFNIQIDIPQSKLVKSIANPTPIFQDIQESKNILMGNKFIIPQQKPIKQQLHSYEYQSKGYLKKNNLTQQPQSIKANMINSAQSDQVIGYSQFTSGKVLNSIDKASNYSNLHGQVQEQKYNPIKTNSVKVDDFTQIIRQTPFINSSNKSYGYNLKQEQMIYSPKPLVSKPSYVSSNIQNKFNYYKKDESVGTLYRQFTDTKVLDILPGQMQDNIRNMRRKYRGIHSKQLYKIK